MKYFLVGILVGVAVGSGSNPVTQSVDTQPLGVIGSGLHLQERRTICLEISRELKADWPIYNTAINWNKNGNNLFELDTTIKNCDGTVLITKADTPEWWGSTEFYPRDLINVQLSTSSPPNRHYAIICHELGHVLGLPHSSGDGSCMDHNQNNPEPTALDLSTVGKEPWSSAVAQNSMLGIK